MFQRFIERIMNKRLGFQLSLLAVLLVVFSCKKDEGSSIQPPEAEKDYQTVPFSITVGITPNAGSADGIEFKQAFADGDIVEITNPQVLYEPCTISVGSSAGKPSATFSGEFKVKYGSELVSGSTQLTAVLKNGTKYNHGKPFVDVKPVESIAEGFERYGYWSCENFTYSSSSMSVSLEQKTVVVEFSIPFTANVAFKYGNADFNELVQGDKMFAVPFGTAIECSTMNLSKSLDTERKAYYSVRVTKPEECLPGLFSVAEDRQVYFSKGNLQYRPMDGEWRLAPEQYHRCFEGLGEYEFGENYANWQGTDKWTDVFYWGMWIVGGNPYWVSSEEVEYTLPLDEDGNLVGDCAYGAEWTVLSRDEWKYLIYQRPDAHKKRGGAIIGEVLGAVILPDDWSNPEGLQPLMWDYKVVHDEDVPNRYSVEEWKRLETAGAVFLPKTYTIFYGIGSHVSSEIYLTRSWCDVTNDEGEGFNFLLAENMIRFFKTWADDNNTIYSSSSHPVRLVRYYKADTTVE